MYSCTEPEKSSLTMQEDCLRVRMEKGWIRKGAVGWENEVTYALYNDNTSFNIRGGIVKEIVLFLHKNTSCDSGDRMLLFRYWIIDVECHSWESARRDTTHRWFWDFSHALRIVKHFFPKPDPKLESWDWHCEPRVIAILNIFWKETFTFRSSSGSVLWFNEIWHLHGKPLERLQVNFARNLNSQLAPCKLSTRTSTTSRNLMKHSLCTLTDTHAQKIRPDASAPAVFQVLLSVHLSFLKKTDKHKTHLTGKANVAVANFWLVT